MHNTLSQNIKNPSIPVWELVPCRDNKSQTRLKQYQKYVTERLMQDTVTRQNIRAFFDFMASEGWTKPCGGNYLRNIRTILKNGIYLWYEKNNITDWFPVHWEDFFNRLIIRKPRKTINPLSIPSRDRILEIISKEPNPQRQLIIVLFYNTGMRPVEIANLKMSDISNTYSTEIVSGQKIDFYTISVFATKTQRGRLVPVEKGLIDDIREILRPDPNGYVFVRYGSIKYDYMRLYRIIRNASTDEQGLWLNPYKLREAHATHAHTLIGDIHLNAATLGHSPDINLKTYVQPMSLVKDAHKTVCAFPYSDEIRESIRRIG